MMDCKDTIPGPVMENHERHECTVKRKHTEHQCRCGITWEYLPDEPGIFNYGGRFDPSKL